MASTIEHDPCAPSQRVYERAPVPRLYDLAMLPVRRLRREVVRLAGVEPRTRVLDVATGTGAQALAFAERCGPVVGIDLSAAMLRLARRKRPLAGPSFVRADAAALPFEDGRFDVACVSFGLHEMPAGVRRRAVHELARVTRPGGTIVVVDYRLPASPVARWLVFHLVKLYERDSYVDFVRSDLRALLAGAGIDVREERPALLGAAAILRGVKAARAGAPAAGGGLERGAARSNG